MNGDAETTAEGLPAGEGLPAAPGLPATEPDRATDALLELQSTEAALVRAELERPDAVAPDDVRRLRYLLRFAHMTEFQPGAAEHGRRLEGRPDVSLRDELEEFRARVLQTLHGPLRDRRGAGDRLHHGAAALELLAPALEHVRRTALERHANEFSARELDGELCRKQLVSVAGGGGGAGYVYIGAYRCLDEAGIRPGFVIGSSMGAIIGLFAARSAEPDWEQYLMLARTLKAAELFAAPTRQRRYGLQGLIRLNLASTFGELFSTADGEPTRIRELGVPYEAVVGGVRTRSFDRLPARFRAPGGAGRVAAEELPAADAVEPTDRPWSLRRVRLASAIAGRMWQVAAFFDPRVVKPIALGADHLTSDLAAFDAAGFSAAIPGVLHYDVLDPDPDTKTALDGLLERESVAALIDGGVTANVPAALAWRRIHDGKLGTRNAFLLAFDCFHPQWDPRHLWLQPITQAVALQRLRDVRYADWIIRFEPTLSPVTLVPGPETVDTAIEWGRAAVEPLLPLIERSLEPVWWDVPPDREPVLKRLLRGRG